jgi:hypothetical protein
MVPVNTAATVAMADNVEVDFRSLNCAACTAGALTGLTSGAVVAQVFEAFSKTKKPVDGEEPDATFTMLGNYRRQKKGKGMKFQPPEQKVGQNDYQYSLTVAAVEENSRLYAQVKALKQWVVGRRGGTCDQHGAVGKLIPFNAARGWMLGRPARTEFAVYFTSFDAFTAGHWVYADKPADRVDFVDYQRFLTAANRPAPTEFPSCAGSSAPDAKMIVLAFLP